MSTVLLADAAQVVIDRLDVAEVVPSTELVLYEGPPTVLIDYFPVHLTPRRTPHYAPSLVEFPVAFVETRLTAQDECQHTYGSPDRFGDALCRCGASAWSPYWVAAGLYGSDYDTAAWISNRWFRFITTTEGAIA